MLPLLMWLPFVASFVLGAVYLFTGEGGAGLKILLCAVFGIAAYLQFATSYSLLGLLLQSALALVLAFWWKIQAAG